MPINDHLQRLDITDFTAGLWDEVGANTLLMPPNSFATLTDYEPRKQGGLRAWYLGSSVATTGVNNTANEIPMGFFARTGNGATQPILDTYLATIDVNTFKARLYRWDFSNGDVAWGQKYIDAVGAPNAGFGVSSFAEFLIAASSATVVLWVKRNGIGAGVYEITAASAVALLQSFSGPMVISQGRVIMSTGEGVVKGIIYYSDVGKDTFTSTAAQQLVIAPGVPSANIGMISERAPADILVGLNGAPWYEINGDISSTSTPVRAMGDDHHQRVHLQDPCRVPGGIAFIEPGGRIYKTDGYNFTSLSDAIARFDYDAGSSVSTGQLAFLNDYLFAPGGKVYDFRTGAWFKSSLMTDSVFHFSTKVGRVYHVPATAPTKLAVQRIFEGGDATVTRCSSGVIQTCPYRDERGRNVRIREVQLLVQCYSSSTFVVSIINNVGTVMAQDTVTGVINRQQVSFLFPNIQSEYLSVKIEPSAENGTSEAPTIECLTIFFGKNNVIGNAPE